MTAEKAQQRLPSLEAREQEVLAALHAWNAAWCARKVEIATVTEYWDAEVQRAKTLVGDLMIAYVDAGGKQIVRDETGHVWTPHIRQAQPA